MKRMQEIDLETLRVEKERKETLLEETKRMNEYEKHLNLRQWRSQSDHINMEHHYMQRDMSEREKQNDHMRKVDLMKTEAMIAFQYRSNNLLPQIAEPSSLLNMDLMAQSRSQPSRSMQPTSLSQASQEIELLKLQLEIQKEKNRELELSKSNHYHKT